MKRDKRTRVIYFRNDNQSWNCICSWWNMEFCGICFCSRWVGSKTVSFLNINCGCRWSFFGARVLSSLSLLLSLPTPWLLSKFISSSRAWAARSSWLLHQLCKGIFFISHASQNASAIIVLLLYTTALLSAPFPTLLLGGELEIERFVNAVHWIVWPHIFLLILLLLKYGNLEEKGKIFVWIIKSRGGLHNELKSLKKVSFYDIASEAS